MKNFFNFRNIIFILVFIVGVVLSIPTLFDTDGRKISLGLDLQGGLSILLGVKVDDAIKNAYSSLASQINNEAHSNDIVVDNIKALDNYLTFELIDVSKKNKMDEFLKSLQGLDIAYNGGNYNIKFTKAKEQEIKDTAITQAVSIIRDRIDIFGLSEPSVTKQGDDNILVQLPGIKTTQQEQEALDLIMRPAFLKMMAVDEDRVARVNEITTLEAQSYGDVVLDFINEPNSKILLKSIPVLDGTQITDARVSYNNNTMQRTIVFSLNSVGSKIFGEFSANNIGKRMAIVLDDKVYSAPTIRERISGSAQISGDFTPSEASNIAIALRSGALSAPLELLEKRSIGPSLGADSIQSSLVALFGAFAVIVVFMVIYYGIAGLIAVSALFVNIVGIIGLMSLFEATLTLPGMAGIVLTIGMAIDANIIINERIREALRRGDSVVKSISFGYINATRAIFDANNTTLIIAVLLYAYGTGSIKGFAITMGIGIFISIITAIIGTHGVYLWLGNKINNTKRLYLWFGVKNKESK